MDIIITLKPITVTVPEDWTEAQIVDHLDSIQMGAWDSFKFAEDWRN